MIIGITGPIGSGKTQVAKILAELGAFVINADKIGHKLLGQETITKKIALFFGKGILDKNGRVNREKIGDIIFSSKTKLVKLNKVLHPLIKKEIKKNIQHFKSKSSQNKCDLLVVDAALPNLFFDMVDKIWVVTASKKLRLTRLLNAGFSRKKILKIMHNQNSFKEYLKIADIVLNNEDSLRSLKKKIVSLLNLK